MSAHVQRYTCPGGCSKTFDTFNGALTHMGMSRRCLTKHKEAGVAARRLAKAPRGGTSTDEGSERFLGERRRHVAESLAGLSLDDDMGDAQLARVRGGMKSILDVCAEELKRRFAPLARASEDVDVKKVVDEVLDVFNGFQSQDAVFGEMERIYPYIEPVEHVFGYDEVHTTDAEGFTHSKKKVKSSGWYIPMARALERLLQEDPRALEMVLRTQAEWAAMPPTAGTSKHVYADVTDGWLFKEHPELGDAQRGQPQNGRVRLAICMYYDGLEVCRTPARARLCA